MSVRRPLAALAALALLAGCTRIVDATPQPEPTKLDCDLIFPGPGSR